MKEIDESAPESESSDQESVLAAAYAHALATPEGREYGDTYASAYARAYAAAAPAHTSAPPPTPSRRQRVRRIPVLLSLVVLGLLVTGFLALSAHRHDNRPELAGSGSDPGSGQGKPLSSLPPDGSSTRTKVLPTGDLQVDQWIRSREPLFSITLSAPRVPGLDVSTVSADQVVVAADGVPADGPRSVGGVDQTYTFRAAHEVHVSYLLSGVVQQSSSRSGRALAHVIDLDVRYTPRRGPSTASVLGAKVLALACSPARPDAAPRPCGTPSPGGWKVHLEGDRRSDRVMAQLDLG